MNNKGLTLLEMMVALVMLGIIVQINFMLMNQMNRSIAKAQKTIKIMEDTSNALALRWTDQLVVIPKTSVLCFTGNATYSCMPDGCVWQDNSWYQGGHKCTGGILYY